MRRGRWSKCSREMTREGMRTGPVPPRCSRQHGHTTPPTRFHEVSLLTRALLVRDGNVTQVLAGSPSAHSDSTPCMQHHCHLHPQGCPHVINTGTFPLCITSVAAWSVYLAILILVSRYQSRYFYDHFSYTSNREITQNKIHILFYLFVILKLISSCNLSKAE